MRSSGYSSYKENPNIFAMARQTSCGSRSKQCYFSISIAQASFLIFFSIVIEVKAVEMRRIAKEDQQNYLFSQSSPYTFFFHSKVMKWQNA